MTNRWTRRKDAARKKKNRQHKFIHKALAAAEDDHSCDIKSDINRLPDEILPSIISWLTVREATATSILSSRWRHLHATIDRLRLPPFDSQRKSGEGYYKESQEKEFSNYMNRINRILDSYKECPVLREFSVLQMPRFASNNIERWLEFSLAREVEIIDLHLVSYLNSPDEDMSYTFPLSNMISKIGRASLPGLGSLKKLSLSAVDVDDRDVEHLLSNFVVLESLSLEACHPLRNLSILGHSVLKLKHLDIYNCWNIKSIEIRDMVNLVSLRCEELHHSYVLQLDNVPKLVRFITCTQWLDKDVDILPRITPCIRNQLLHLKLVTDLWWATERTYKFTKLMNLKHLQLDIDMDTTFRLDEFTLLIEESPLLEKLEIKFWWSWAKKDHKIAHREPVEWSSEPHNHLKKVMLSGYLGCPSEFEFALYIMKTAVALEEMIIKPCEVTRTIRRRATRRAWQQFRPTITDSIDLFII